MFIGVVVVRNRGHAGAFSDQVEPAGTPTLPPTSYYTVEWSIGYGPLLIPRVRIGRQMAGSSASHCRSYECSCLFNHRVKPTVASQNIASEYSRETATRGSAYGSAFREISALSTATAPAMPLAAT